MSDHKQYESILESISGGFFALDPQFNISYWNRAAQDGTGLGADEVLGKNVFEVFPNVRGTPLAEKYELAMQTRTFQNLEASYSDERFEAWYDVRIYPGENGLSVFFQDVTEQKAQERQKEMLIEISRAINTSVHLDELCLRAAEKIALLCSIPSKFVCVYLYDPRGNEIRLVAPASFDVELPQQLVHQRVDADAPRLAAQAAFRREVILSDDLRQSTVGELYRDEMQSLRLKTLMVIPLAVQNEVQGVLEILTIKEKEFTKAELDILTVVANDLAGGMSRKRLTDELRMKNLELEAQTQKTQEASDTLKKFLATFSHELRSPLNSIIGFSEILTKQLRSTCRRISFMARAPLAPRGRPRFARWTKRSRTISTACWNSPAATAPGPRKSWASAIRRSGVAWAAGIRRQTHHTPLLADRAERACSSCWPGHARPLGGLHPSAVQLMAYPAAPARTRIDIMGTEAKPDCGKW